jgi:hypothetical protein
MTTVDGIAVASTTSTADASATDVATADSIGASGTGAA